MAEDKTTSAVSKSGDGRVFSIVNKPLASGVVTHEDITEPSRAKQIAHMARHDALTDLPNRGCYGSDFNTS
jgi:hypothetical protein